MILRITLRHPGSTPILVDVKAAVVNHFTDMDGNEIKEVIVGDQVAVDPTGEYLGGIGCDFYRGVDQVDVLAADGSWIPWVDFAAF